MANVLLFIDFWNFQLGWNEYMASGRKPGDPPIKIAWKDVSKVFLDELPSVVGAGTSLTYKGTRVYASVDPRLGGKDAKLKNFLHRILGQMTGFRVQVHERRPKTEECPGCGRQHLRLVEKGVDTSIVTELFEGAINNSYDTGMLVSNDSDLVPAIEMIQDRLNKQIIHVGFNRGGHHVRTAAWSHLLLDGDIAAKLTQPSA